MTRRQSAGHFTPLENRAILSLRHETVVEQSWRFRHIFGILAIEDPGVSGEAEQQTWIKEWARRIETLALSPVALPLLEITQEITQAFGFLGSQALFIAQPLLSGIVSETTVERVATLLNDPGLLEQLKMRLEGEKG